MATGKVKWFNDQKGFGFIASEIDAKDVFVHHSVIESEGFRTLQDGETVEYEAEGGPKGLKATRVKRSPQLAAAGHSPSGHSPGHPPGHSPDHGAPGGQHAAGQLMAH